MGESSLDLDGWIAFFNTAGIPILKRTARELGRLDMEADELSTRGVTDIISADPLMVVALLRYLQHHKHSSQQSEVIQIEQALMMLGIPTVVAKVQPTLIIEDLLRGQTLALVGALQTIRRAARAAYYARDWSVRLKDTHFDEVHIVALLHNFAEILMWCYAPQRMLQVRELQLKDGDLRHRAAQQAVLGFKLSDLQLALAKSWVLPEMLISFMEKNNVQQRQMQIVVLATNLARHSANNWDNAALPDDYLAIGELLHLPAAEVKAIVDPTGLDDVIVPIE